MRSLRKELLSVAGITTCLAFSSLGSSAFGATIFYGNTTTNCGSPDNCAYINPAATTDTNQAGDTYAPVNYVYSNFTNYGTFDNSGYVRSEGAVSFNAGFTNGTGAVFNNVGPNSRLEQIHGSNAGTVNNYGQWNMNLVDNFSSRNLLGDGLYNTSSGTINNYNTLTNRGTLNNDGTVVNYADGVVTSSYNNAYAPFPYPVGITNNVGGSIYNYGGLINGDAFDAPSSTIINRGAFTNEAVVGKTASLVNFDDFENYGELYVLGASPGSSELTNYSGATFQNLDTVPNFIGGTVVIGAGGQVVNQGDFRNGIESVQNVSTLSIESGATFRNSGNGYVSNSGRMSNGGEIYIENNATFKNFAYLDNTAGGTSGTIRILDSSSFYNGSSASFVSGNSGQTWVEVSSSASFVNDGYFENGNSGSDVVVNAGSFDNNGGMLNFGVFENSGQLLNSNTGTFRHFGGSQFSNTSVGAIDNRGTFVSGDSTVNDGSFSNQGNVEIEGLSVFQGSGTYTQTAGKTVNNGVLSQSAIVFLGGTASGSGVYQVNDFIVDGATLAPGDPVTLTIDGNLNFVSGFIDIKIAGQNDLDQIFVTGFADLSNGGTIKFDFLDAYAPSANDTFDFLLASGGANFGGNWNYEILGLADGFDFNVDNSGGLFSLTALTDGVSIVPVPGAVWLFASALGMLGAARMRKQQPATPV